MAGRTPAFTYPQFKEIHAQFVAGGKEPTYDDIKSRFGGKGSDGLIAAYKAKFRGEQTALPETAKIPDDLANQIRTGLMALHSTLRAEAEASLRVAHDAQADEFMQIGLRQDQSEEEHRRALEVAERSAQKARVQLEDRDSDLARLRHELNEAQGDVRRLEIACNVAFAERDDARANLGRVSAALDQERASCSTAAQASAVAQERANAYLEQISALKSECIRLAGLERDADEVAGLKALIQVNSEKAGLMSLLHAEQQQTIIMLTAESSQLRRERDEFKGRADEAQQMHLSSLGVSPGAVTG